ncbi:MAG TPA: hypothetical protein PLU35_01570 [Phycisphaerales bacterium]|nr:hypothetical protein [Phycisphaerales bacterium]
MPKTLVRTCPIALAIAALTFAAPALTAQPEPAPAGARPTGEQIAPARTRDTSALITLRFPGGSLPEYVQAVKLASQDNPVNVVIRGEAGDVRLPQVFLERVSIRSALELVTGNYAIDDLAVRADLSIKGALPDPFAGPGEPIYLIEVRRDTGRRTTPTGRLMPAETLVVSIRDLITPLPGDPANSAMSRESVLTAVEAALTTAAADSEPTVRFHEDTGLVILNAPQPALLAAQNAINAISSDLARRRELAKLQSTRSMADAAKLEIELADARANVELQSIGIERAKQRFTIAEQELNERRKLVEQSAIPPSELRASEERLAEAVSMMRAAEVERERAARRMNAMQAMLETAKTASAGAPTDPAARLTAENAALRERVASLEAELKAMREELARLRPRDGGTR